MCLNVPTYVPPKTLGVSGGKVEANEDIYDAIKREIFEELGCKIETHGEIFNNNTYEYDAFIIHLLSIKCRILEGTPINSEHSKLIWLKRENLNSLKWAPADISAVEQLMNEK